MHHVLSKIATSANVIKGLTNTSLISIGQLCDDNCTAIFEKTNLRVYKNNILVVSGIRNFKDGLWDIVLGKQPQYPVQVANIIIRQDKTKRDLAEYLHKCAFSPCISTFRKAIRNGNFLTWPGIEELNFNKLIQNTLPTARGHLDQERKNLQSTKPTRTPTAQDIENDFFPTDGVGKKTYEYVSWIENYIPKLTTYTDLTGRFPYKSTRGNEYMFVMYDFDSNAISARPLKNRQAKTILDAWEILHTELTKHGHPTKNFVLDNECSIELKAALRKNNRNFELTPPNVHRRNAAERATRTLKNHFLAGLATCDPELPICEWDRLLPQEI